MQRFGEHYIDLMLWVSGLACEDFHGRSAHVAAEVYANIEIGFGGRLISPFED